MPLACFSPKSVGMTDAWERFASRLAKQIVTETTCDNREESNIYDLIVEMLTHFRGKYE